ncbi:MULTISPECIES: hypothetical protein [Leeuwenhoekiella]|uniref:hypothetical protein n=1 Tax=Leeuwenhoekiella TaxID=283735 RepID=UPI000C634B8B|nr:MULTISPECIES: hypothetical protein [Leeuwenhoekiella]MAO43296.1 hypothetical protein [Leeuwenhoekiella sp.]|tara:strand:- start:33 stop:317 length:285 start_codon:yes stop_codon:yes gene_type:complete
MTTLSKFQNDFTNNIIGYSAIGIILSTCLGSVAIMTTLMHGHTLLQMFFVMITVVFCSMHNASILTVQKPQLIFKLLIASTVVNTLIIAGGMLL